MAVTEGFWGSPKGELIEVPRSHIDYMLNNPEALGMTREEMVAVYKRFKEPIGWEGKARAELLLKALEAGWTRIRYYAVRSQGWTFEYNASAVDIPRLKDFASKLVDKGLMSYDDPMQVNAYAFRDGEVTLTRGDTYTLDRETGEGGVLRFLDSCDLSIIEGGGYIEGSTVYVWEDSTSPIYAVIHADRVVYSRYINKSFVRLFSKTDARLAAGADPESVVEALFDGR